MPVKINSTGGGSVTLSSGSIATDVTATFPATTGTVVTTGSTAAVTPAMLSTGAPAWDGSGNMSFNSGYGSVATAFGCRAWVNFNGTGTVAIRASGNVSSITDNGTGDYTVNFTNAMPDANYAVAGVAQETTAVGGVNRFLSVDTTAAGNVRVYTSLTSLFDVEGVHVAIFR